MPGQQSPGGPLAAGVFVRPEILPLKPSPDWMEEQLAQTPGTGCYILDSCPVMVASNSRRTVVKTAVKLLKTLTVESLAPPAALPEMPGFSLRMKQAVALRRTQGNAGDGNLIDRRTVYRYNGSKETEHYDLTAIMEPEGIISGRTSRERFAVKGRGRTPTEIVTIATALGWTLKSEHTPVQVLHSVSRAANGAARKQTAQEVMNQAVRAVLRIH